MDKYLIKPSAQAPSISSNVGQNESEERLAKKSKRFLEVDLQNLHADLGIPVQGCARAARSASSNLAKTPKPNPSAMSDCIPAEEATGYETKKLEGHTKNHNNSNTNDIHSNNNRPYLISNPLYQDTNKMYETETNNTDSQGNAHNAKITDNVVANRLIDRRKMEDPLVKPLGNVSSKLHSPASLGPGTPSTAQTPSSTRSGRSSRSYTGTRSKSLESSSTPLRPHTGGDSNWDAIHFANSKGTIGLSNLRLLKRLGYGDIGSVYLVELQGTNAFFTMKVMDKASLTSRNKLLRAHTKREILGLIDHPFLPTLYSYFETDKFYCLVIEFCSGGNLHSLRQKQPNKYFTEEAARFYASEVLLALEYLHMLGIVYRDLKPENVLVRDQGHIMLSDFDLSLRCSVNPTFVKSSSAHVNNGNNSSGGGRGILNDEVQGCIQPSNFFPRILPRKKNRKSKSDFGLFVGGSLPELMAEPTNVRSMSFVGTHEYLAPEIIRGEGHGSAVDWWTFGLFLYELLNGTTPFKGQGNRATLFNVVGQPLRFPDTPQVSLAARDLIKGLLVKEPHKRIAYKRGATEIKQHPFFEGMNWALVRSALPPHVPELVDFSQYASKETPTRPDKKMPLGNIGVDKSYDSPGHDSSYIEFEYF